MSRPGIAASSARACRVRTEGKAGPDKPLISTASLASGAVTATETIEKTIFDSRRITEQTPVEGLASNLPETSVGGGDGVQIGHLNDQPLADAATPGCKRAHHGPARHRNRPHLYATAFGLQQLLAYAFRLNGGRR